jgi:hypothetical protein
VAAGVLAAAAGSASAQLRVATWNITAYSGGRVSDIQTVVYGTFNGRQLAPDVILVQEVLSASAMTALVSALNTAPGSPGDWAAAPYIAGPDRNQVLLYRTSKIQHLRTQTIAAGGGSLANQPRNTYRFDVRPVGYTSAGATIGMYNAHMKAGSTTDDQARRLVETQRIRDNARGLDTNPSNGEFDGLPAGYHFLLGADTNTQSSAQAAYQKLVGVDGNAAGRFFDPINAPGSWNNNIAFRFLHTQDPATTGADGGMDDRHDQILLSGSLIDGQGFDYIGNPAAAFSTSTWDDPNHSYRVWGNDGSSFNTFLTTTGNVFVGPAIAQAIINAAAGGGHIPVVLNLRVPARAAASLVLDFGVVEQGSTPPQRTLTVTNTGDTALWTAPGIAALNYSFVIPAGFTGVGGSFIEAPGGGSGSHVITMPTATLGVRSTTLTVTTNAPDQPTLVVTLLGEVVPPPPTCAADWDGNGEVEPLDISAFFADYRAGEADFDGNGETEPLDIQAFFAAYRAGC